MMGIGLPLFRAILHVLVPGSLEFSPDANNVDYLASFGVALELSLNIVFIFKSIRL